MVTPTPWTVERIRSCCSERDGCWIWMRSARRDGYGQARIARHCVAVHRLAYQLHHGITLASKTHLHHTCGVRRCVNPDHLQPVSQAEHNARHANEREHCRKGHRFTTATVYVKPDGRRECRECARLARRLRQAA